jgi:peroxiredoxin
MWTRGRTARVVLGLALGALLLVGSASALEPGKRAPELSGTDTKGRKISLAALRGKVVIIDFMASWCAPCKQELPLLNKLYLDHAPKLVVIAVSVDEKADNLATFLKQVPVAFSVMHDAGHTAAKSYSPARMPSSYIIDKQGLIRYVHGGFRKGDEKVMEQEVTELLR